MSGNRARSLVVEGPGDKKWTYPLTFTTSGSFYHKFDEKEVPTGYYQASIFDDVDQEHLASVEFSKESYRIPRFEVQLFGPDTVPTDRAFTLTMTADYYAGGRVVGQELTWQVTQQSYGFSVPTGPPWVSVFNRSAFQRWYSFPRSRYHKKGVYRRKRFCNTGT